jgi:hypothetical protein
MLLRCAAVAFATLAVAVLAFAARADALVYWVKARTDTIGRANLDGTGANPGSIHVAGDFHQGVAVDDAHVYWTVPDSNTIGRANIDGGTSQTFIPGARAPEGWRSTMPTSTGRTARPARSGAPTSTGRESTGGFIPEAKAARSEWLCTAPTCTRATSPTPPVSNTIGRDGARLGRAGRGRLRGTETRGCRRTNGGAAARDERCARLRRYTEANAAQRRIAAVGALPPAGGLLDAHPRKVFNWTMWKLTASTSVLSPAAVARRQTPKPVSSRCPPRGTPTQWHPMASSPVTITRSPDTSHRFSSDGPTRDSQSAMTSTRGRTALARPSAEGSSIGPGPCPSMAVGMPRSAASSSRLRAECAFY